jgi:hypothetical protein
MNAQIVLHLMADGMFKFLADYTCKNKGDQQLWECASIKDCYLTLRLDLCHLLRHTRGGGDDGRGTMI